MNWPAQATLKLFTKSYVVCPASLLASGFVQELRPDKTPWLVFVVSLRFERRLVGDNGIEPLTSCMSSKHSNQLS